MAAVAAAATAALALAACQCISGDPPPNNRDNCVKGSNIFLSSVAKMRVDYNASSPCRQRLWREAFILSAAWEGSHEGLGRYTRADPDEETYFVVPTYCAVDDCYDHRVDWAKNAQLDASFLMGVQQAEAAAGRALPSQWLQRLRTEGAAQEIAVDTLNNDNAWTYCPTSYNPVAPWHTKANQMTLLPQYVWNDLPGNFTDAADGLNCSFGGGGGAAAVRDPPPAGAGAGAGDCAASAAAVAAAFNGAAPAADAAADALRRRSPEVLAGFRSAAPPGGTYAGLAVMLRRAKEDDFRATAAALFDALLR